MLFHFESLRLLFLKELRNRYPTRWSLFFQFSSELLLLTIYWYTAQAFEPKAEWFGTQGSNYFSYIIIGESTLMVPILLFTVFSRLIRTNVQEGTLEPLLLSKQLIEISLVLQAMAAVGLELLRLIIVLVVATVLFSMSQFGLENLILVIVAQLVSMPLFIGLGLLGAAVIIALGRGERLLPMISTGLAVLAGAYFPIAVFPSGLTGVLQYVSPFNLLLEVTRGTLSQSFQFSQYFHSLTILSIWSLVLLPVGFYALHISFRWHRRRTRPLLFLS